MYHPSRNHLVLPILAASGLAGDPARAQSFNIDLDVTIGFPSTPALGAPSSAFGAAAAQVGFWNAADSQLLTPIPLNNLSNTPTGATLQMSTTAPNGFAHWSFPNNSNTGDWARLLNDCHIVNNNPGPWSNTYTFSGLLAGTYKVYIVVTNPPFSLFREYVGQLVKYNKKFLIIGNQNAIKYKGLFELIQDNKMWLGASIHSGDREFGVPAHYPLNAAGTRVNGRGEKFIRVKGVRWFTNLDYEERHEDLEGYKTYSPREYPTYANYDAIEVSKTKDIPMDYKGEMGVPITFLDRYNPDQFEIVGTSRTLARSMAEVAKKGTFTQGGPEFYLANGDGTYRRMYSRLVIKNKRL